MLCVDGGMFVPAWAARVLWPAKGSEPESDSLGKDATTTDDPDPDAEMPTLVAETETMQVSPLGAKAAFSIITTKLVLNPALPEGDKAGKVELTRAPFAHELVHKKMLDEKAAERKRKREENAQAPLEDGNADMEEDELVDYNS
eukprot:8446916-Alexandrium_andersonii.AAC.1